MARTCGHGAYLRSPASRQWRRNRRRGNRRLLHDCSSVTCPCLLPLPPLPLLASRPPRRKQDLTATQALDQCKIERAPRTQANELKILANASTVHWGFQWQWSKPLATAISGDEMYIEMVTHHGGDDIAAMITGDPGMESIYRSAPHSPPHHHRAPLPHIQPGPCRHSRAVRVKAPPLDPLRPTAPVPPKFRWVSEDDMALSQRGATDRSDGAHLMTGPIWICGAEEGDVLQIDILDLQPRKNPSTGKAWASNAATWSVHMWPLYSAALLCRLHHPRYPPRPHRPVKGHVSLLGPLARQHAAASVLHPTSACTTPPAGGATSSAPALRTTTGASR